MRAPLVLLCAAALAACGGPADEAADQEAVTAARHLFTLTHAPVAGNHPTALVHLPKAFRADGPLNLVVHYHGWSNCIANDGEAAGAACTRGGSKRIAHNLIAQMEASGLNAALVLVEIHFDQQTSDDGHLAEAGFFRSMILELLPDIGGLAGRAYTEADLGGLVLTSHSGGYQALAHTLDRGGLTPHVKQVILLDSAYGNLAQFEAWANASLGQNRLAVVYTDGGGTLANSQKLATDLKAAMASSHVSSALILDDRTYATQPDAAFGAPLVFKHSALSHDGTALYYFGKLVAHAGL
jgi:hypothetical protein